MTTEADYFPHPLIWTAGIAVILFSVLGIAAIMGWIPTSLGRGGDDTAISRQSGQSSSATKPALAKPPAPTSSPAVAASTIPRPVKCAECGVIESMREISTKGEGSGMGAVGGAVVGGLIGNQVGSGRGNTAATAIGAVGGAVAGNEVEKRVKASKSYETTVRLDDGSSRVVSSAHAPAWHTGDHVKIVGGEIQGNI